MTNNGFDNAREALRALRACPEPAGNEVRTAAVVERFCLGLGAEVKTRVGGHGVVAKIGRGKPVVAVRAEMDALPTRAGAEHLCGHDVHMAAVIGMLSAVQGESHRSGTVVALFQPAEEPGTGAASMLQDGLAEVIPAPSILLAQHLSPLPYDMVAFRPGTITSCNETVRIEFRAEGGHPGLAGPERSGLSEVVARLLYGVRADIGHVTLAQLGDSAVNALPSRAIVTVDLRGEDERAIAARRASLLHLVDRALVAGVDSTWTRTANFVGATNHPLSAARVHKAFTEAGRTSILMPAPAGTSDDVGQLADALGAPLVYWFWGASGSSRMSAAGRADLAAGRAPEGIPCNHSPHFAASERSLESGVSNLLIALSAWVSPAIVSDGTRIDGPAKARRTLA